MGGGGLSTYLKSKTRNLPKTILWQQEPTIYEEQKLKDERYSELNRKHKIQLHKFSKFCK